VDPSDEPPEVSQSDDASSEADSSMLMRSLHAVAEPEYSDDALRNMELRHRTKNILTIVQSLVNQTLKGDVGIAEARETLTQRLVAMGEAIDLLMRNDWEGAAIDEIVAGGLTHRIRFGDRLSIRGPSFPVGPGAAMSLSLALHELETNAIKYGALSNDCGTVEISWSMDTEATTDAFCFDWREAGGPPVHPPGRKGFGTTLISKAVARRMGGMAELDFKPEGLAWHLRAPAAGVRS
jgi:two-component sensor histidine kinase